MQSNALDAPVVWGGVYYARVNTTAMYPPLVGLLEFIVGLKNYGAVP